MYKLSKTSCEQTSNKQIVKHIIQNRQHIQNMRIAKIVVEKVGGVCSLIVVVTAGVGRCNFGGHLEAWAPDQDTVYRLEVLVLVLVVLVLVLLLGVIVLVLLLLVPVLGLVPVLVQVPVVLVVLVVLVDGSATIGFFSDNCLI
jgi:hypothetical protein